MEVQEVREKAKELKATIETALKKFRDETGYTPSVEITTKTRPTNTGKYVSQSATVTVTL